MEIPKKRHHFAKGLLSEVQGHISRAPDDEPATIHNIKGVRYSIEGFGSVWQSRYPRYRECLFWLCGLIDWGTSTSHDAEALVIQSALILKEAGTTDLDAFNKELRKAAGRAKRVMVKGEATFASSLPQLPPDLQQRLILGEQVVMRPEGHFESLASATDNQMPWHSQADRTQILSRLRSYVPVVVPGRGITAEGVLSDASDRMELFRGALNLACLHRPSITLGDHAGPYSPMSRPPFAYVTVHGKVWDYGANPPLMPSSIEFAGLLRDDHPWSIASYVLDRIARKLENNAPEMIAVRCLISFQEALDHESPGTCIAALWRSLEILACTHENSPVIDRISSLFKTQDVVRLRLQALASMRNDYVHQGAFSAGLMPGVPYVAQIVSFATVAVLKRMEPMSTKAQWEEYISLAPLSKQKRQAMKAALARIDRSEGELDAV